MSDQKRSPVLRVIEGGRPLATADEVLRDGARVFSEYLTQRLPEVGPTDPDRVVVERLASQYRALAG